MLNFYSIKSLGDSVSVVLDLKKIGITMDKKDKIDLYNYFRHHVGYVLCKDNILLYGNDIEIIN